jgi:hypothetical protein
MKALSKELEAEGMQNADHVALPSQ